MEQAGLELIAKGASAFEQDLKGAERAVDDFAKGVDDGAKGFDGFEKGAAGATKGLDGLASVAGGAAGIIGGALVGGLLATGAALVEVSEKSAIAERALGQLGGADMSAVLNDAALLEARYGADFPAVMGAAQTLMAEFGMSHQEAMDFIVAGYSDGLDASGDFLDSIGEYSNLFAENEFSAAQFYSTMQTGAAGGVLGTDKISDAFKEFGIRVQELGDDIFGPEGALRGPMSDEAISEIFDGLRDGSVSVADAYEKIIPVLRGMDDPIQQNRLGVALFGTQWEDLGASAILGVDLAETSLAELDATADGSRGRIESLGEIWPRVWGGFVSALAPANEALLNFINALGGDTEALAALPGWAQDLVGAMQGIPQALTDAQAALDAFFNTPLGTAIKDSAQGVADYFAGPFGTDVSNGIGVAQAAMDRIASSDFGQRVQRGAGVVASYMANEWPGDFQRGVALVEGYLAPFGANVERELGFAKVGAETVASYILDEWPTDFQNGIDLVVGFFTELPGKAQTAFDDLKTAIVNLPETLRAEAEAVGTAIVDGIASGITAAAGAIASAATSAAQSALTAAKNLLGIESPSRVFAEEVGEPVAEGFARGILDSIGAVSAAAARMGDEALAELADAGERARALLEETLGGVAGFARGRSDALGAVMDLEAEAAAAQERADKASADEAAARQERLDQAAEAQQRLRDLSAEWAEAAITARQNLDPERRQAAAERMLELEREAAEVRAQAAADDAESVAEIARLQELQNQANREAAAAGRAATGAAQQLRDAQAEAAAMAATDPGGAADYLELRQRQILELIRLQEAYNTTTAQGTRELIAEQIRLTEQAQAAERERFDLQAAGRAAELGSLAGDLASTVFSIARPGASVGGGSTTSTNNVTINGANLTLAQLTQLVRQVLAESAGAANKTARMT